MAHLAQKEFCLTVKNLFPGHFIRTMVLDCGSLDINGTNRYLFDHCNYTGVDLKEGKNVNFVMTVHEFSIHFPFKPIESLFDVIISTEMLEHDKRWRKSLKAMFKMLKPGGLLLITAATTGREEHGTKAHHPETSPFTNDYYRNVTEAMLRRGLPLRKFKEYEISIQDTDIRFWGIKK